MEIKPVNITAPKDSNTIIIQTHFIKSAEDLHEALVESCPGIKFGLAFNESSGPCLVRSEGNDEELVKAAEDNALKIGAGHLAVVFIRNAFPINVLNRIKQVSEVCGVYCASANPIQVIVAETEQGRGVLGVVDGLSPKGVEGADDKKARKEFLRKIKYKL